MHRNIWRTVMTNLGRRGLSMEIKPGQTFFHHYSCHVTAWQWICTPRMTWHVLIVQCRLCHRDDSRFWLSTGEHSVKNFAQMRNAVEFVANWCVRRSWKWIAKFPVTITCRSIVIRVWGQRRDKKNWKLAVRRRQHVSCMTGTVRDIVVAYENYAHRRPWITQWEIGFGNCC